MNFSSTIRLGAAAALTTVAFTLPAHALVVISNQNLIAQTPSAATDTPTSTTGTFFQDVTGSVGGVRRSPWDTTSTPNGQYNSISANSIAFYVFGWAQSSLAFMWGSPDSYNEIRFFNGVDSAGSKIQVGVFTGANVYTPLGLSTTPQKGFVNVTFAGAFDSFTMKSVGQNAFEYAKLEVPEPGSLALLGLGLAGLAAVARRKQKQA